MVGEAFKWRIGWEMDELRLLQEKALRELEVETPQGGMRVGFSIWVMPSFEAWYRWTVYRPLPRSRRRQSLAACTIWRRDVDEARVEGSMEEFGFVPNGLLTMEYQQFDLEGAMVQGFQERLRGVSVPVVLGIPKFGCLDGTGYRFAYDQSFFRATLEWHEDLPEEWQSFTSAVREVLSELDALREG